MKRTVSKALSCLLALVLLASALALPASAAGTSPLSLNVYEESGQLIVGVVTSEPLSVASYAVKLTGNDLVIESSRTGKQTDGETNNPLPTVNKDNGMAAFMSAIGENESLSGTLFEYILTPPVVSKTLNLTLEIRRFVDDPAIDGITAWSNTSISTTYTIPAEPVEMPAHLATAQDGTKVTVQVVVDEEIANIATFAMELDAEATLADDVVIGDTLTLTKITKGDSYPANASFMPSESETPASAIATVMNQENFTLPAGAVLATYEFTSTATADTTYNFTLTMLSAADELDSPFPWFSESITGTLDYQANPAPQTEGWQYFSFSNSYDDFFTDGETRNYSAGAYFDKLSAVVGKYYSGTFANHYLNRLRDRQDSDWGGSCYGFAAVEGLVNTGSLTPDAIDSGAETLAGVGRPAENTNVRNLLNYYYLTQFIPVLRSPQYEVETAAGKQALVDMAESVIGGTPYMFSYAFNSGSGHAIILEGGRKLDDGSYELTGQDNRYHGYTLCERGDSGWADTGTPVTVSVQIAAGGASCQVYLAANTHFTRDGRVYYNPQAIEEKVYAFEPVHTFDHFAGVSPVSNAAPLLADAQLLADDSGDAVLYYEPNGSAPLSSFVLKDQNDKTIINGSDFSTIDSTHVKGHWLIVKSTASAGKAGSDGDYAMESQATPAGLMASLDSSQATAYSVANVKDATLTYLSADNFASVSAGNAGNVLLDLDEKTVSIQDNRGTFSLEIAGSDGSVAVISGSAAGTITAAATENGITLDAPAGSYDVRFTDTSGKETDTSKVTSDGSTTVMLSDPAQDSGAARLVSAGEVKGQISVETECAADFRGKVFCAFYDANGRMLSVASGVPASGHGTLSFEINQSAAQARVFLLDDARSAPQCASFTVHLR